MMTKYLLKFKQWYNQASLRERIFSVFLGLALIYAFFTFVLFYPLEEREMKLNAVIKDKVKQINNWNTQITALNQLSQSPLYKKWLLQNQAIQKMQSQYKNLVQYSETKQWQEVIKNLLESQNNVVLEQIKNEPETLYQPINLPAGFKKIYQQKMILVVYSNYFDIVDYIRRLEKLLPRLHWDRLDYEVTNYPVAKIKMEFSILYEKPI